jgi:two-component system response regulator AtoC
MLDEIGEMPQALQAKILHVLQDREFTKLGSNRTVEVDVRVIAATNRDLEAMMRQGTFREDLYYRLQVIEVHIPPLRERREEIPQLIEFFLLKFASVYHRPPVRPSLVLHEALLSYEWPGNIRELENMMKRLVVLQDETLILAEIGRLRTARANADAEDRYEQRERHDRHERTGTIPMSRQPSAPMAAPPPAMPAFAMPAPAAVAAPPDGIAAAMGADGVNLQELARHAAMGAEKEAIQHALERFRWNRRKTAEYLQVSYKTLLNKMKECGISESPQA